MSLINDALKRAKEAQRQAPPPPSPQMQFRPVELAPHSRHSLGLIGPAALATVALLALLFVWHLADERKAIGPREAQALPPPAAQPIIAPQPAAPMPEVVAAAAQPSPPPPQPFPQTASATGVTNPLAVTAAITPAVTATTAPAVTATTTPAVTARATPAAAATATPASAPEAKEQENEVTKSVAIRPPPVPKWPPLKLQAIAFNPKQPCVLINGTMLFVGKKLGDLQVVAIGRESATLVGVGRTNTLTMR